MEPRAALRKVINRAADELTTAAGAVSAHAWAQTCTVRKHEKKKKNMPWCSFCEHLELKGQTVVGTGGECTGLEEKLQ